MGQLPERESLNPINEILKEMRSRLMKLSVTSQYTAGVADTLRRNIMLLEAALMTDTCPVCHGKLVTEFSERAGELLAVCDSYECRYTQVLNQIGY